MASEIVQKFFGTVPNASRFRFYAERATTVRLVAKELQKFFDTVPDFTRICIAVICVGEQLKA
jgi:hypothetical protein